MSVLYVLTGGAIAFFVGLDYPYYVLLLGVGAAWPQFLKAIASFKALANDWVRKHNSKNGDT